MMHKAWSSIEEVPYCFSRSSVEFQGHTALKIIEFDPNRPFPDCNSSLNSPIAMKCYTKLETAKAICPIVFQGHPSNFKVTRDKTSPILTQIGRFRTIGQSQLSNPSDLPCWLDFCSQGTNFDWGSISQGYIFSKFWLFWPNSTIFSCDQAALWMVQSVCLSVRPSIRHTFLTMFPSLYHHEIFRSCYQWQKWRPCKRSRSKVKVTEVTPHLAVSGL